MVSRALFLSSSSSLCFTAKNIFRVRSQEPGQAQSHTLQVNDVFHKQQWLNCLRSAISVHRPLGDAPSPASSSSNSSPSSSPTAAASESLFRRRPSSVSAIVHMEETDENCPQAISQSAPSSPSGATSCPSAPPTPPTTPPLHLPALLKSKKDKKSSVSSLGKRKETMVWTELGLRVTLYLCACACIVLHQCSVLLSPSAAIFPRPLHPSHPHLETHSILQREREREQREDQWAGVAVEDECFTL